MRVDGGGSHRRQPGCREQLNSRNRDVTGTQSSNTLHPFNRRCLNGSPSASWYLQVSKPIPPSGRTFQEAVPTMEGLHISLAHRWCAERGCDSCAGCAK